MRERQKTTHLPQQRLVFLKSFADVEMEVFNAFYNIIKHFRAQNLHYFNNIIPGYNYIRDIVYHFFVMVERQLGRNGGIDGGGGVSIISPSTYNVNESKRVHPNDVLPATSPGTGEKFRVLDVVCCI